MAIVVQRKWNELLSFIYLIKFVRSFIGAQAAYRARNSGRLEGTGVMFSLLLCLQVSLATAVPSLSLFPHQQGPGATVVATVSVSPPAFPNWLMLWFFNGEAVASVQIEDSFNLDDPTDVVFALTAKVEPSRYARRVTVSAHPPSVHLSNRNFTSSLTVTGLLAGEEGALVSASDVFTFNVTTALDYFDDCDPSLPFDVMVEAPSSRHNDSGELLCANGGILFSNGSPLLSNQTTCDPVTSQWSGYGDVQCWTAPTDVALDTFYSPARQTILILCRFKEVLPRSNGSLLHIGDDVHLLPFSRPFTLFPNAITPRHNGRRIFCQADTPFTRIYNETGRSQTFPLVSTERPTQNSTPLCVWYLGVPAVCDVIFRSNPLVEFNALTKDGERLSEVESNEVTVEGSYQRYRFHRNKVSVNDSGLYGVIVNYVPLSGLRYTLFFNVSTRGLPPPTDNCTWFLEENAVCYVTLPTENGTEFISLQRNGKPVNRNRTSVVTTTSGRRVVRFQQSEVDHSDDGLYVVVYKRPSRPDSDVIVVTVFVIDYPFNSALIIGVTILSMIVVAAMLVLSVRVIRVRSAKRKEEELQMLEMAAKSQRTPSRATSQPIQYRTS